MIKKVGSFFVVYSHKGRRMGAFTSLAQAKKRLKQIEYFKNNRK